MRQPNKKRIAIVIPEFKTAGGVATMGMFLYNAIQASDQYSADIISLATSAIDTASSRLFAPMTWRRKVQSQSARWKDIPYLHIGAEFTELEFQRYRPRKILTNLLNQYDLVQVVSGTPAIGMVTARIHKPACIFVATTTAQERKSRLRQTQGVRRNWARLMTWVTTHIEPIALSKMKHVFAESLYTKQLLASLVDERKISIAVPGVDTQIFHPLPNYGSDGYILAVGRFSDPRKNLKLLLTAYHKVIESYPEAPRLVLAGRDGLTDVGFALACKLGIEQRIDVYQNINNEKLAELYRHSSLFVLPSDEEGLGIVILEAMASGLPVVSTRCGGPETAVVEGKTGYLTPVGDAARLAECICTLLLNPSLRKEMGCTARQIAESRFSTKAASLAYIEKYDEILEMKNTNR